MDTRTTFLQLIRFLQSVLLNLYYTFFVKSNIYLHLAAKFLLHDNPFLIWEQSMYEIQNTNVPNWGRNAVEG
jgi:hypothetical protein